MWCVLLVATRTAWHCELMAQWWGGAKPVLATPTLSPQTSRTLYRLQPVRDSAWESARSVLATMDETFQFVIMDDAQLKLLRDSGFQMVKG